MSDTVGVRHLFGAALGSGGGTLAQAIDLARGGGTVWAVARIVLIATSALMLIAAPYGTSASHAMTSWPKTAHLRDGSTVSVWRNGHVVERDASGQVESDSFCGSYTRYATWVRFLAAFRQAVLTQDHTQVATRLAWPLAWNHGSPWHSTPITNKSQLLHLYDAVFVPKVVRQIKAADPRALFCKNISQVALGQGIVWGDEPGGRLAIVAVNGSD